MCDSVLAKISTGAYAALFLEASSWRDYRFANGDDGTRWDCFERVRGAALNGYRYVWILRNASIPKRDIAGFLAVVAPKRAGVVAAGSREPTSYPY